MTEILFLSNYIPFNRFFTSLIQVLKFRCIFFSSFTKKRLNLLGKSLQGILLHVNKI